MVHKRLPEALFHPDLSAPGRTRVHSGLTVRMDTSTDQFQSHSARVAIPDSDGKSQGASPDLPAMPVAGDRRLANR